MSDERRGGGGGLGAAFVLLIFVGAVVKFWVWIVAAIGVLIALALLSWLAFWAARRVDASELALRELEQRADQQHAWTLAGDDRGTYGRYPPAVGVTCKAAPPDFIYLSAGQPLPSDPQ